jgi:hypothetical protein
MSEMRVTMPAGLARNYEKKDVSFEEKLGNRSELFERLEEKQEEERKEREDQQDVFSFLQEIENEFKEANFLDGIGVKGTSRMSEEVNGEMRVTIPADFIEGYRDREGQWDCDSKRIEDQATKENFDKALEVRDIVLKHAEVLQNVDGDKKFDQQFRKPGEVVVDAPETVNELGVEFTNRYSGTLKYDPDVDQKIKHGEEDAQHEALKHLDVSDKELREVDVYQMDLKKRNKLVNSEKLVNSVDITALKIRQNDYSYHQQDEQEAKKETYTVKEKTNKGIMGKLLPKYEEKTKEKTI